MRLHFSVGQFSFALSTVQNSAIKWAMRHVCLVDATWMEAAISAIKWAMRHVCLVDATWMEAAISGNIFTAYESSRQTPHLTYGSF